jgi:hypothetical protein
MLRCGTIFIGGSCLPQGLRGSPIDGPEANEPLRRPSRLRRSRRSRKVPDAETPLFATQLPPKGRNRLPPLIRGHCRLVQSTCSTPTAISGRAYPEMGLSCRFAAAADRSCEGLTFLQRSDADRLVWQHSGTRSLVYRTPNPSQFHPEGRDTFSRCLRPAR